MAGKTTSMSQIKQILLLLKAGKGVKTISSITGIARYTVKSYRDKVKLLSTDIDGLLKLEDPILESRFHAGNPAYSDNRFEVLKTLIDGYVNELENPKNHLTRYLLWKEYRSSYPAGYGYSQFCYHLSQHQAARHPSMVLRSEPADKLLIDFAGDTLAYVDLTTGELINCQVFVACLKHTDYSFAKAVHTQSVDDFVFALQCCLSHIGGVPVQVIPDNFKAAVVRANRYEPTINQVLQDLGNHYGFAITPARVRKPKDKAQVEDQVKLVYQRVYAKLRKKMFHSLSELNLAIGQCMLEHNQTRMRQHPYTREERFLSLEKPFLKPLAATPFEIKFYATLKVAKNNHIYLGRDKHYYSVPYQWIGWEVKVIYTHTMVSIYASGQPAVNHLRSFTQGGYTTRKEHLCSTHQQYLDRSPDFYFNQAKRKSEVLGRFVTLLFQTTRPVEQLYNNCNGIFQLHRATEPELFNRACQAAIDNEKISYGVLKNIIASKAIYMTPMPLKPLPEHDNVRGAEYYAQQLEISF